MEASTPGELTIGREICVLEGHGSDVNCTAWSPISKDTLCSCSGDKKIRVWKIDTDVTGESQSVLSTPERVVVAHKFYVNSCTYNPSGDILATTSSDDTVKIWSTASWTCVGMISLHTGGVRSCTFSMDGNLMASASDDATVKVWEVGSLRCITTITTQAEGVSCCQFAPNGWLLATGDNLGVFLLFDAFSAKAVSYKNVAHDGGVRAIALQPPGKPPSFEISCPESVYYFATGGEDFAAKVWRVQCDQNSQSKGSVKVTMVAELVHHTGPVYSCAFHPTLPFLVTGSRDKSIILWNTTRYETVQRIQAHSRYVTNVNFSPSGLLLATASNDRTVKIWELETPETAHKEKYSVSHQSSTAAASDSSQNAGLLAKETWNVNNVCKWVESVAKQKSMSGTAVHPDDLSAVGRLSDALDILSLSTKASRTPVTDEFKCPITCETMKDPVVAADGYSYERSAITEWFSKGRRTSPATNLPLTSTLLLPNRILKIIIDK